MRMMKTCLEIFLLISAANWNNLLFPFQKLEKQSDEYFLKEFIGFIFNKNGCIHSKYIHICQSLIAIKNGLMNWQHRKVEARQLPSTSFRVVPGHIFCFRNSLFSLLFFLFYLFQFIFLNVLINRPCLFFHYFDYLTWHEDCWKNLKSWTYIDIGWIWWQSTKGKKHTNKTSANVGKEKILAQTLQAAEWGMNRWNWKRR